MISKFVGLRYMDLHPELSSSKRRKAALEREREMEKQGIRGPQKRLVLVPCPVQGHITPMLQLGTVLHSRGFSITIVHTRYNAPNPSNHPDFIFLPLQDNLSDKDTSGNFITFLESLNSNCKVQFQNYLLQMMEQEDPYDQVACIIFDTLMYFSETVANDLKVPSLVLRTSTASYLEAYFAIPRLLEEGYIPLQDSKLKELVPELYPLRFMDLPIPSFPLEDTLKLLGIMSSIRTSSAVILNTMDYLEPSSLAKLQLHYNVSLFPVGPLHKLAPAASTSLLEEDMSSMVWLDRQAPNSVLYISLGSLATMDEKELTETAWGLANSGKPFLWVIRPGSVRGTKWDELLPDGFREKIGERGYIVKWAPQKEVLAHVAVGGFWSHCGWNSVLESISEGVPMICKPCFIDQKVNARYLTYVWNVGIELEHMLDRGEIERAIKRLLMDKEGEEIRHKAIEMKEIIQNSVSKGGSSDKTLNELAEFILSLPR